MATMWLPLVWPDQLTMSLVRSAMRRNASGPPCETPVGTRVWLIGIPAAPS